MQSALSRHSAPLPPPSAITTALAMWDALRAEDAGASGTDAPDTLVQ
jgi:hypothetical protein